MGRVEKMPKIDVIQYYRELLRVLQSNMIVLKEGLVVFFLSYHTTIYINQTCIMWTLWTVIGVFCSTSPNPKLGRE